MAKQRNDEPPSGKQAVDDEHSIDDEPTRLAPAKTAVDPDAAIDDEPTLLAAPKPTASTPSAQHGEPSSQPDGSATDSDSDDDSEADSDPSDEGQAEGERGDDDKDEAKGEDQDDEGEDQDDEGEDQDDEQHRHDHDHHDHDHDHDDHDHDHDSHPPSRRKPAARRTLRGCLGRALLIMLALMLVAGVALYLSMRRDPLVTRPETPPKRVLISNVQVIDVVAGSARPNMDVLLEGGTIVSITPHRANAPAAQGSRVIEGTGKSLIPGLIDIHCHLQNSAAPPWAPQLPNADLNMERLLYSGVTRVLDPGSVAPATFELRSEVNARTRLGPNMYAAGPIFTAPGGHPVPMLRELLPSLLADNLINGMTRQVGSEAEARAAVAALKPSSPDFIKIAIDRIPLDAPRLDPAVAAAIVREAKARGIRAVAHIGTTEDALDAANAGVSAWIHGVYKERISDENIAKLAAFKIPMAPTMVVFRSYAEAGRGSFASTPLEEQVVDEDMLDARTTIPDDYEVSPRLAAFVMLLYEQRKNALDNVRRLSEAGVVMMAGSDAQANVIHGPALHRELVLLSRAGLSPIEVLRAATLNPARFLSQQQDPAFGIIAAGKQADLVLLNSNPLQSVDAISAIDQVILAGVPLIRHPLSQ